MKVLAHLYPAKRSQLLECIRAYEVHCIDIFPEVVHTKRSTEAPRGYVLFACVRISTREGTFYFLQNVPDIHGSFEDIKKSLTDVYARIQHTISQFPSPPNVYTRTL
jgi:hypothetical protein